MRVVQIIPDFGLGGIQKGGCVLAIGLKKLECECTVVALGGGVREADMKRFGIAAISTSRETLATVVRSLTPDVVHVHAHTFDAKLINDLSAVVPLLIYTPVFGRPPDDLELLKKVRLCCVGKFTAWRLWRWLGCPDTGIFSVPITPFMEPRDGQSTLEPAKVIVARSRIGIPKDAFVFGRLARSDELKWHAETEWMVSKFLSRHPSAHWLSVGLPQSCGLATLGRSFGKRFTNYESMDDFESIATILQCLDVQFFASRYGECFSASIAEGMGIGVPCIALCHPLRDSGEVEQIEPGKTGLLAANPAGLVSCAEKLHDDRDMLCLMKKSAWAVAHQQWNFKTVSERLLSAYKLWLQGSRHPEEAEITNLITYGKIHFSRLDKAVGTGPTHKIRCALMRHIYLKYPVFKFGRSIRHLLSEK